MPSAGHIDIRSELGHGTILPSTCRSSSASWKWNCAQSEQASLRFRPRKLPRRAFGFPPKLPNGKKRRVEGLNDWRILDVETLTPRHQSPA